MLMIRLSRFGSKGKPTWRLTIAEKTKDAKGDVLEYLGSYNPRSNPKMVQLKADRIKYWLSKGAQASPSVHNLLVTNGVIDAKKVKAWRPKKKEQKPGDKPATAPTTEAPKEEKVETPAPAEEKSTEEVKAE